MTKVVRNVFGSRVRIGPVRTVASLTAGLALLALLAVAPPPERGRAMVAADHIEASRAGVAVMERGGNAADAAAAAALAAGVVQPAGSGLGGGGFAVVVDGDRRVALDFREVAPSSATRDMYLGADGAPTDASRVGPRAVAVPGESRGLAKLVREHGRLSPSAVAEPAIRLASRGFQVGGHLAKALSRTKHAQVQALFSAGPDRDRYGEIVRRQELARTLRRWAATAGEDLHTGAGAAALERATDAGVQRADLADYQVKQRTPLVVRHGRFTLVTMPPPSSGGVVLGQVLRVLEGHDLKALGHNSSDYIHLVTEAFKHGYADRAQHLGDPDFVEMDIPRLLSDERVREIRGKLALSRTFEPDYYGELIAPPKDAGTQHISVLDEDGRAVALTTTINTSFGSGVVAQDLGLILNNEMDDFAAAPGVPNAYGLVGNEANAIEPGKRPLSSMTPTVILDEEGRVVLVIGASGGSFIISSVLQVFLNVAVFDMNPQEAVSAPRFHHQWQPDKLMLETHGFPQDVVRSLEGRGHETVRLDRFSSVQVITVGAGEVQGGADPSKGGWPAGLR